MARKKLTGAQLRVAAAREAERNGGAKKKTRRKKAATKKRAPTRASRRKAGACDLGELAHAASVIDRARKLVEKADGKKTRRK